MTVCTPQSQAQGEILFCCEILSVCVCVEGGGAHPGTDINSMK